MLRYFYDVKPNDIEEAILRLVDEDVRADFGVVYKCFAQSDKVLPSPKPEHF